MSAGAVKYGLPKTLWAAIPSVLTELGASWRYATRPDVAEDGTEPWIVTETLYRAEYPVDDWPPDNAREFMAWFKAKLAKIPARLRASAAVKFETEGSYDEASTLVLTITYDRDETPAEITERRALYAGKVMLWEERQRNEEEAQRAQYAALKEKFAVLCSKCTKAMTDAPGSVADAII